MAHFPQEPTQKSLVLRSLSENDREVYLRCYGEAWELAHATREGFDAERTWLWALWRAGVSDQAVRMAYFPDGRFAGILALDEKRSAADGVLWVSFLFVEGTERGTGLGRALLGAAEARARELGRSRLALCTAKMNSALRFYEHLGFLRTGTEPGALEALIVLEKEI